MNNKFIVRVLVLILCVVFLGCMALFTNVLSDIDTEAVTTAYSQSQKLPTTISKVQRENAMMDTIVIDEPTPFRDGIIDPNKNTPTTTPSVNEPPINPPDPEPSDVKSIVWKILNESLGPVVAAGIMGNIDLENGAWNPAIYLEQWDTSSKPFGLVQWTSGRKYGLKTFCEANGYEFTSAEGQAHYIVSEFKNAGSFVMGNATKYPDAGYGFYTTYESLMAATDPSRAAQTIWATYERPGTSNKTGRARAEAAAIYYAQYNH